MGGSVASGSTTMSGADQLRPFLSMLKKHNVRELDTARVYNNGQSEEDLGAISEAKNDFTIATKAPGFSPGSLSYQKVIDNSLASLKALKQEKIDLYYFHGPDRQTPLDESCKAIHQLHQEGKIATFGISNFNVQEVEDIHSICSKNGWITPAVYQGLYIPQVHLLGVHANVRIQGCTMGLRAQTRHRSSQHCASWAWLSTPSVR